MVAEVASKKKVSKDNTKTRKGKQQRKPSAKKRVSKRDHGEWKESKNKRRKKNRRSSKPDEEVMANRRGERKRMRKYREIPVHVVDEHDGTMVCMLRAIETGHLPGQRVKLLHFDSHPDLANPGTGSHHTNDDEDDKGWDEVDSLYDKTYNIRKFYDDATDIATWITPMCLMGHVDVVVWACSYWCDQFPTGRWQLLVGKDKNDGGIKIGCKGDKQLKCLEYWEGDNATCKEADFEYCREWTLMVVRFNKKCELPAKAIMSLAQDFSEGPWVLDIDEDFFSCNNPFLDQFQDMFGAKMQQVLTKVYNVSDSDALDTLLKCFEDEKYKKPWSRFVKSKAGKKLLEAMNCDSKKRVLKRFHTFLRKTWPTGGFPADSEDEEEFENWEIKDFFNLEDLHECGQLASLPHHISTATEIKKLMNQVDELIDNFCPPVLVTVATSRLDRYLPDSQASLIHKMIEEVLMNRYDTETVIRLDKPNFSVETDEKQTGRFVTEILMKD